MTGKQREEGVGVLILPLKSHHTHPSLSLPPVLMFKGSATSTAPPGAEDQNFTTWAFTGCPRYKLEQC